MSNEENLVVTFDKRDVFVVSFRSSKSGCFYRIPFVDLKLVQDKLAAFEERVSAALKAKTGDEDKRSGVNPSFMQYTGDNEDDIVAWMTGNSPNEEWEEAFDVNLVPVDDPEWRRRWRLTVPARNGPVDVYPSDYIVREKEGEYVRLSSEQFYQEHINV